MNGNPLNAEMLATVINCVIQDIKDKSFITGAKRNFDLMPPEAKKEADIVSTLVLLNYIIDHNVSERKEVLYYLASLDFTDETKMLIEPDTNYSKSFKKDLLVKLGMLSALAKLDPYFDTIVSLKQEILLSPTTKKGVGAYNKLYDEIFELNKTAFSTRVSGAAGNVVAIDPIGETTLDTIGPVLQDMRNAVSNKIKTFPAFDQLVGGGLLPGTEIMLSAATGKGKSKLLQNLFLYAAKNNERSSFEVEAGLIPCMVYFSFELTKKQVIQRHLAWCGLKLSDEEIMNMKDSEADALVIEASRAVGIQLPVFYIERLTQDMGTTTADLEDEFITLKTQGYTPVLAVVDYIDHIRVKDSKFQSMGEVGAEGSSLLKQKAKELRNLSITWKLPVLTASQLSGVAEEVIGQYEAYLKQLDVVEALNGSMLAGSKPMKQEIEVLIFVHTIEIEQLSQEEEILKTDVFMAMQVKKDRDNVARYNMSKRDMDNNAIFQTSTMKIRNSGLGALLKRTSMPHVVVPSYGFRLADDDYGRSIRMFYPTEQSSFISMPDMLKAGMVSNVSSSIEENSNEMDEI